MIANTFFGTPSDYLNGRQVHEAPLVMIVPLVILAALTMITGLFGPEFSQFLGLGVEVSLIPHLTSLSLTIIALLAGGIPAYFVYVRKSIHAERFRSGMLSSIHKLLENGYYFDRLYYKVFVEGYMRFSQTFRQTHTGILNVKVMGILVGIILFLALVFVGG